MRLFHWCPFKFVDCSGCDPRGRLVCLRGSLEKPLHLYQDSYFLCRSVIPEKRSRSSLAVRSYIAQIDGSKEQGKLKEESSLAVSLREVEGALKVSYVLNVDQMKHEKQTDGTGERVKLQALATVLNSGWPLQRGK